MNLSYEMNKFDKIAREIKNLQVLGKIYLDGSDLETYLSRHIEDLTFGDRHELDSDGWIVSFELRNGIPWLILDKDRDLGAIVADRPTSYAISFEDIPLDEIKIIIEQMDRLGVASKEDAIY